MIKNAVPRELCDAMVEEMWSRVKSLFDVEKDDPYTWAVRKKKKKQEEKSQEGKGKEVEKRKRQKEKRKRKRKGRGTRECLYSFPFL